MSKHKYLSTLFYFYTIHCIDNEASEYFNLFKKLCYLEGNNMELMNFTNKIYQRLILILISSEDILKISLKMNDFTEK